MALIGIFSNLIAGIFVGIKLYHLHCQYLIQTVAVLGLFLHCCSSFVAAVVLFVRYALVYCTAEFYR